MTQLDRIEQKLDRLLELLEVKNIPAASPAEILRAKEFANMGARRSKEYFDQLARQQKQEKRGGKKAAPVD